MKINFTWKLCHERNINSNLNELMDSNKKKKQKEQKQHRFFLAANDAGQSKDLVPK